MRFGRFWTKHYEIDLFAPFREIANDIKRMREIKKKRKRGKRK